MNDRNINATAYVVTELEQESNGEKRLAHISLFAELGNAKKYLHERYDNARRNAELGAGVFSADFSDNGWYAVVDNDGDLKEGFLSERTVIQ